MNILEALKKLDTDDMRVTCGGRWLYWNGLSRRWVVRGSLKPRGKNRVLIATADEAQAVAVLLGQESAK